MSASGESVIEYPLVTEKAMNAMDFDNAIQFVVSLDATKGRIASEIEDRYEFTVASVNTQVTPKGKKKAVVTLEEEDAAEQIASRIGVF
jgi:large subunit ribosomal protein L23